MKQIQMCLILCSLLLVGCEQNIQQESSSAQAGDDIIETALNDESPNAAPRSFERNIYPEKKSETKVSIDPSFSIIQVLDVNIDLDSNDEQILVLKDESRPDSPVQVVVADYDTLRDGYIKAWQQQTSSTQRRFFTLSLMDVIGDHHLELVCSGINSAGEQQIEIFRRVKGSGGVGLDYASIFSLSVAGTVEIQEKERSQAYLNGLKNGESFQIKSMLETDGERISRTYAWRSDLNRYTLVDETLTPMGQIEDQKLRRLFAGSNKAFINFLGGNWVNENGSTIFFDPEKEEITLYSGDIQEIYRWTSSYRSLSSSISMNGENELMPDIMRIDLWIRVLDYHSIYVTLKDIDSHYYGKKTLNKTWSGTYYSSSLEERRSKGSQSQAMNSEQLPELSGYFRGDSGEELFLDAPAFTLKSGEENSSGGFAVYMLDVPIFELKVMDESGIVQREESYRLVYREEEKSDRIVREMIWLPGRIGVRGFRLSEEPERRFRQVEYFSTED